MDIKKFLFEKFNQIFIKQNKLELFFTPGRVNLIGEHTDYNGGFVFPCALNLGTYALVQKREDNNIRMYSINFENDGVIEFFSSEIIAGKNWGDYCKGVVDIFLKEGYKIEKGADIIFYGNIPNGAGLSSSASLEVLMGIILKDINKLKIDMIDIVKFAQKAENQFIGVNCGIMDQFAVGMGKKNMAIALNCGNLKYNYAPIDLRDETIIIMNTNKRRGLAESKYNERRKSCEIALNEIKNNDVKINYLCDLNKEEFKEISKFIKSEENFKRAKHIVEESQRVVESLKALHDGELLKFGKLMNESHISLRDNYEVTGKELDAIVESAWSEDGCVGARMTGGGFGGCAVAIVKNDNIKSFIKNVGEKYEKSTKLKAEFYIVNIGNGARKIGEL